MCRRVQRVLKLSYRAWMSGQPLPSYWWLWVGRDVRPQIYWVDAVFHSPLPQWRLPKWGRMKRKHQGGPSWGTATTWWVLRELPGRMVKLADEGPDGTRQEPLIQAAAGGLLRRRLLQAQLIHSSLQDVENSMSVPGLGSLDLPDWGHRSSPTAPFRLIQPVTCCHRGSHLHLPQTRSCHSQPQRDAGLHGRRRRHQPLLGERVRNAWSEPA